MWGTHNKVTHTLVFNITISQDSLNIPYYGNDKKSQFIGSKVLFIYA